MDMASVLLSAVFVTFIQVCSSDENTVTYKEEGVKIERLHIPKICDFTAGKDDVLSIHYKGTLKNGKEFDSSYRRNVPFQFTLGQGQVIKGWDIGVKGMCIGEKRRLTIPSDKGYGDYGFPPAIPGGATLIFEIELVDSGVFLKPSILILILLNLVTLINTA